MKFTYDPRYNVAYIRLRDEGRNSGAQIKALRVSDELNVDIAPDGTVYGIELLNANEQLRDGGLGELIVINEATGERTALQLTLDAAG